MSSYMDKVEETKKMLANHPTWDAIQAENVVRMQLQNRFPTGVEIARYTAGIMRKDMAEYDADSSKYTQSLGAWHGFVAQQSMMSAKRHYNTLDKRYIYMSGWMVAATRSVFGPLPDQSMQEKTTVPDLVREIYNYLLQADARALRHMFVELDEARANGGNVEEVLSRIDNFETHVRPMIADIDAGFGNEEATFLLAKRMIENGACALQLENQVSDAKQCGHQAGKVTVPHEDFLAKVNACRHAFLELGVEDGVIIARTDSLGASLTQKIPVTNSPGDIASKYISFLATDHVDQKDLQEGEIAIVRDGQLQRPKRMPNGLYEFREETGFDRVVLDCTTALENGADLLWIETEKPNVEQIGSIVNAIRKTHPKAKLVYNNSPSFNWTLKFREQVYEEWAAAGKDLSAYPDPSVNPQGLMKEELDNSELAQEADRKIQSFQKDAAQNAGIFHHLITLPTYHDCALGTDQLAKGYFGEPGMLAYVAGVQRQEIRRGLESVKHQDLAGSNIGDDRKKAFSGKNALLAAGEKNTMNQF